MIIKFGETDGDAECNVLTPLIGYIVKVTINDDHTWGRGWYDVAITAVSNRAITVERTEFVDASDWYPLPTPKLVLPWEYVEEVFIY